MIYLDNAATSYPKPEEVYEALDFANRNLAYNAGRGESKESLAAFKAIDECRLKLSAFAKVSKDKIVFTDSATMAANIIIFGLGLEEGDVVYVSPFEHNAICRPLELLKSKGVEVDILIYNHETLLPEMDLIQNQFAKKKPKAIFISEVSNVTGTVINFDNVFQLGKKLGSTNILDSSQAFGLLESNYSSVDYQIFAGHKTLYSSFGVGGFIYRGVHELSVSFAGGTGSDSLNLTMPSQLPYKFEFGSSNIVAIYGLSKSLDWLSQNDVQGKIKELTEYLYKKLEEVPKIKVYGSKCGHLSIASFNVDGYSPSDVGSILNDEYNISVRTGFHCAPFIHQLLGTTDCGGTVRISVGFFNSKEEIDLLIEALKSL